MKILVCITGASGVNLGLKLLENLPLNTQNFAIITKNAKNVLELEVGAKFDEKVYKNVKFLDNDDLSACVSSGSFGIDKTIIAPCSINTLAKIASGLCDNLVIRSAAVCLKEHKKLILAVREMPLSTISLRQMAELSTLGAIISPPVYANYTNIKNLSDLENFIVGKWLDSLEISHFLYKRWE